MNGSAQLPQSIVTFFLGNSFRALTREGPEMSHRLRAHILRPWVELNYDQPKAKRIRGWLYFICKIQWTNFVLETCPWTGLRATRIYPPNILKLRANLQWYRSRLIHNLQWVTTQVLDTRSSILEKKFTRFIPTRHMTITWLHGSDMYTPIVIVRHAPIRSIFFPRYLKGRCPSSDLYPTTWVDDRCLDVTSMTNSCSHSSISVSDFSSGWYHGLYHDSLNGSNWLAQATKV